MHLGFSGQLLSINSIQSHLKLHLVCLLLNHQHPAYAVRHNTESTICFSRAESKPQTDDCWPKHYRDCFSEFVKVQIEHSIVQHMEYNLREGKLERQ